MFTLKLVLWIMLCVLCPPVGLLVGALLFGWWFLERLCTELGRLFF